MTNFNIPSKIALIVTDIFEARYSQMLALELDERLHSLGYECCILDLGDRSYEFKNLESYDAMVLVGTNSGPMYTVEMHALITTFRQAWRHKTLATVMVSKDRVLAEAAELQLRRVLEILGASHQATLFVAQPEIAFDEHLALQNEVLEKEMGRFLDRFQSGIENLSILPDRLIA